MCELGFTSGSFVDAKNAGEDDGAAGAGGADQWSVVEVVVVVLVVGLISLLRWGREDYQQWLEGASPDWPDKWLPPDPTQMCTPPTSTPLSSTLFTTSYTFSALQSIRPNEVPVGGGWRYHWYTAHPTVCSWTLQPIKETSLWHQTSADICFDTSKFI